MTQLAERTTGIPAPPETEAYKAVLDHAATCPDCPDADCPVGAQLRQTEREARQ